MTEEELKIKRERYKLLNREWSEILEANANAYPLIPEDVFLYADDDINLEEDLLELYEVINKVSAHLLITAANTRPDKSARGFAIFGKLRAANDILLGIDLDLHGRPAKDNSDSDTNSGSDKE